MSTILIKSKKAMALFAARLAKRVAEKKSLRGATVIGLVGNLGAGKTTFTQSFLKTLGVTERVSSPTFILMRPYEVKTKHHKLAYHLDTYRLDSVKELLALGFKKIIREPGNIVLVEWADRFKKVMPKKTIWIEIKHGKKKTERVIIYS